MSIILNIDTALQQGSVCIAENGKVIYGSITNNQSDHAGWLHPAIDDLLKENNITIKELAAIAVTIGPGSYTGLRIGLAAAKGLCYALKIPLIGVSTLEVIASAVAAEAKELICPCIDARRMDIYTAVYNKNLEAVMAPQSMTLEESSFKHLLKDHHITFCGNTTEKIKSFLLTQNAIFIERISSASELAPLAFQHYRNNLFVELAYSEPSYLREFYFQEKKKG
jgi:tRNA threonylcarbamoyladenosine biosynthesis protein TsaB